MTVQIIYHYINILGRICQSHYHFTTALYATGDLTFQRVTFIVHHRIARVSDVSAWLREVRLAFEFVQISFRLRNPSHLLCMLCTCLYSSHSQVRDSALPALMTLKTWMLPPPPPNVHANSSLHQPSQASTVLAEKALYTLQTKNPVSRP